MFVGIHTSLPRTKSQYADKTFSYSNNPHDYWHYFSRGAYYYVLIIIYLGQEAGAYSSQATCGSFEGPIWLADKI